MNMAKGKVRLFCAGGAGVNIGKSMEKHRNQREDGFAEIDIVYIDTSMSNMGKDIDKAFCHVIDGVDGAGQKRDEHHTKINDDVPHILKKYKPADFNIVIASSAGGSGSVIAPLVVRDLLNDGQSVIVLLIGSTTTLKYAQNTLNTLKSFDHIAHAIDKPVVVKYLENNKDASREDVDTAVYSNLMQLLVLFSRENSELDTSDLFNWINFNRVTSYESKLVSFMTINDKSLASECGNICSIATLANRGDNTDLVDLPEYQVVGYIPDTVSEKVNDKLPIHYITCDGIFPSVVKNLAAIISQGGAKRDSREDLGSIMTDRDKPTASGLVL